MQGSRTQSFGSSVKLHINKQLPKWMCKWDSLKDFLLIYCDYCEAEAKLFCTFGGISIGPIRNLVYVCLCCIVRWYPFRRLNFTIFSSLPFVCSTTVAWTRTVSFGRVGSPRSVYIREPTSDIADNERMSPTATSLMRGTVRRSRGRGGVYGQGNWLSRNDSARSE
ncbi:uncharacterized protein EI90DRAFT_1824382 [Cantharellus anzutake]|uniref:uncharacterized protein n=1 Tax=Cantharellus anzutake TaxID=1750568 RepID=UPI001905B329|nr:uncharacterized protein EI90DRAFT_1824382 [Cantharellus anzutake]KAF8327182.1 hypothetical protein EI90DRAFT_1824382 [Cantharellus anzutake]